ncbi:MAG: magnesium transporter [Anaerolineaceae bacterium]|nr:magnesium transporter [Anaerolineaceae bacterium]
MVTSEKGIIDVIVSQLREAIENRDWKKAKSLVEPLRPPDQVTLFAYLNTDEQDALLKYLDIQDTADILEEMEDEYTVEVAGRFEIAELALILDEMEPDKAADLLGDLTPEQADQALAVMEESEDVLLLLQHEDKTAGGLMTAVEITLDLKMTVKESIQYLRRKTPEPETIYYLFVVDEKGHAAGVVSLRDLVVTDENTCIADIMDSELFFVYADEDQEVAARLMARYDLLALPVLGHEGELLGLITYDDSLDVLQEEATEDIYRLGGVPEEQPVDVPIPTALGNRMPWLVLNLITAMASATVLSLFEGTIARVAALAAFFPIVAGVSGSAATQTLTVTVRGLALGEILPRDGAKTLLREVLLGTLNGIAIGGLVAVIALVWKDMPVLGLVVGIATLLNMICAGFAGVLVPLLIQRLKIDPALASPILVTTTTDTLGYLVYLGLASVLITNLI